MRPEFLKWPKASLMTTRPTIMGRKGMVTSGHYLASMAGFNVLKSGGNAIDAAVAACFCINLLEPQNNGIGGEVPILIYIIVKIQALFWMPLPILFMNFIYSLLKKKNNKTKSRR